MASFLFTHTQRERERERERERGVVTIIKTMIKKKKAKHSAYIHLNAPKQQSAV